MKNISVIIIISCFFISCNQNINEDKVQEVPSALKDIDSNVVKKEINPPDLSYGPIDILRVFPENLTVDGSQRYFLNDTLFTGLCSHYENDIMLFEIQFENGRKNGKSRFWNKNGQKKNMQTFVNGIVKGPFTVWDNSGKIIEEGVN